MKTRLYAAGLFLLTLVLVTACGTGTSGSTGQYPSGRITIAVPTEPGSGYDLTARQLAEILDSEGIVDVPITVQNRPGGMTALLGGEMVNRYKGKDDIVGIMALTEQILQAEGRLENGLDGFTPLARMMQTPVAVFVPADSPYTDLDSLTAAIADKPGAVPIAVGIEDSLIFAQIAKAGGLDASKVNLVTYTGGGGEQATALLTGDVKVAVSSPAEFDSLLKSGEVKALAVVNDKRIKGLDVPTAVEQGYDVTLTNWRGVYGPADMPDKAVKYWRKALKELSTTDEWTEKAETMGFESAYLDGDELEAFLADTYKQVEAASESLDTELFPEE